MSLHIRLPQTARDFTEFLSYARGYSRRRGYHWFSKFETVKDVIVDLLYKRRGKYSRPFLHTGMMGLLVFGITFGPTIVEQSKASDTTQQVLPSGVLSLASNYGNSITTAQGNEVVQFRGGEIIEHTVEDGDTISSVAAKYNLHVNTILWQNNLTKDSKIKPGDKIQILPVDGIRHKVQKGETIYTIAKKYGLDESQAQGIVDYPFNEFQDDENFTLTVGQWLMVPDGVKQDAAAPVAPKAVFSLRQTPNAGTVSPSGSFSWPASGILTQGYKFYHKAYDIANRGAGSILAADSGTVIVAGWPSNDGYGNRVMIDHHNGYITLYAHMSVLQVQVGQNVNKGAVIGQMGSTGHSTGTHCHFEIRHNGVLEDPGIYLK
ncbi:MAG: M23 family metallopeptidase [Patescibacteria group bacterium]